MRDYINLRWIFPDSRYQNISFQMRHIWKHQNFKTIFHLWAQGSTHRSFFHWSWYGMARDCEISGAHCYKHCTRTANNSESRTAWCVDLWWGQKGFSQGISYLVNQQNIFFRFQTLSVFFSLFFAQL